MKIIYLLLDAISYNDSWLSSDSFCMPNLKNYSRNALNFHNHYSVTHNTIGNVGALFSGLSPTLSGVMGRLTGFENNKYGYLQHKLCKIDCSTHFMTPTKFIFSSNKNYKFDFDSFISLSSSMADYRVCAEKLNQFYYFKKIKELFHLKNSFLVLHYIDCHEPYETPLHNKIIDKNLFPNIWKFLFTYENIFYRIPRRFLRLYMKPSSILHTIYKYKQYPYLRNLKPKAFGPLLSPMRYSNFYEKCWNDESLFKEFLQIKLLAHSYLDLQVSNLLNYIKKDHSKNTIIFLSSDHGNNGTLTPLYLKKNGCLNEFSTHIPLSIITFDEHLKSKYKLENNVNIISSHTDFYNTILRLFNVEIKDNEFSKNLFNMSNSARYILSEFNDSRKNQAQTRLISENHLIDLRVKAIDNPKDWLLYDKKDLLNNPTAEEFNIYKNYKTKYNNFFSTSR